MREVGRVAKRNELDLNGLSVDDSGLAQRLANSTIAVMGVASTAIAPEAQGAVTKADDERRVIEYLQRMEAQIGPTASKGLGHIRIVELSGCGITDEKMKYLSYLKNLSCLDLSSTSVGDLGLKQLAALRNIEILNLANTKVTSAGLRSLENSRRLAMLILDGTRVKAARDFPFSEKTES